MPRTRIDNLGSLGVNADTWASLLPPQAWTSMSNCRTVDQSLASVNGENKLFNLSIRPVFHCVTIDNGDQKIIVSDGERIHAYALDGTHVDITPNLEYGSETPGDFPWSGGRISNATLNTVLVINSVSNGPFYWAGGTTKLQPLPGWDPEWRCAFMMAYKYYLVAMNMVEVAGNFIHKIRWSSSAAEGELPTLWIPALSNDAGDDLLGESEGMIIGGVLSRDVAHIVKSDAIYSLQHIGGTFVMQTSRLHGGAGTTLVGGFAEMRGMLAIFTDRDLLVFDGNESVSIIDKRIRKIISNSISPDYWKNSQLYVHYPSSSLILMAVGSGHTRFNNAVVYNWEEDTWTVKKLMNSYGMDNTLIQAVANDLPPWDDLGDPTGTNSFWVQGGSWDEQRNTSWNIGTYQPTSPELVIYESNEADTAWWVSAVAITDSSSDGTPKYCVAERLNVPLEGADGMVMVREVWVDLTGNIPVNFYIGTHKENGDSVTWAGPYTITPNQPDQGFRPRVSGRYIGWRVESNSIGSWNLSSMTIDWERVGER